MKMQLTILLLSLCFVSSLHGQGWKNLYSDQPASEVALSSDGNYFLLTDNEILKIDPQGNVIWTKEAFTQVTHRMIPTFDGGLIYTSTTSSSNVDILKLDGAGNEDWLILLEDQNVFNPVRVVPVVIDDLQRVHVGTYDSDSLYIYSFDYFSGQQLRKLAFDKSSQGDNIHDLTVINGFELGVLTSFNDQAFTHRMFRISEFGDLLSSTLLDSALYQANTLTALPDGSLVVCGLQDPIDSLSYPTQPILVQKIAPDGLTTEWIRSLSAGEGHGPSNYFSVLTYFYQGTGLTLGTDGHLYLAGIGYQGDPNGVNPHLGWGIADPYLVKMDTDGNILYERKLLNTALSYEFPLDIIQSPDGTLAIAGESDGRAFLLRTDSLGYVYSNTIKGRIARTANNDCVIDGNATPFENWIVQAGNGNNLFFDRTDENGDYEIRTDSGDYLLTVFQPGPYWEICQDSQTVSFPGYYLSDSLDMPVNALVECPYMEVDISALFLRRCFESTYHVNYCNNGTDTAYNVEIAFTLDPYLELIPPSFPWFQVDSLNFGALIGTVAPGECGQLSFRVLVSCDAELGQTHCTEARITPDSFCLPNPLWEGAEIAVDGGCEGDSIRFSISNTGAEDMSNPLNYIVVEDHMIMFTDQIPPLGSGGSFDFALPSTGATLRLIADQVLGFPYPSQPTVAIEGCNGTLSPGFVTQFAENEGSPFTAIDCQENVGAYDPNDKQGFPRGYDPANIIEDDTELEYRIRFQNTGTDTAFNVLILDTLSAHLDLSTVRPGASSHDYQFEIRDGGVLAFIFPDIMLPDSNVNLAGSQGFVNFKVAQTPGNPIGTEVLNRAAIYFDFNEPIITNQTWHTIGEPLIVGTVEIWEEELQPAVQVEVFPNPFTTQATFRFDRPLQQARFQLFDLQGRSVRDQAFSGSEFLLPASGLRPGLLLFRITDRNGEVVSGKLILSEKR